jgi:MFS transporter, DHA3 family, macrolide efflux protein
MAPEQSNDGMKAFTIIWSGQLFSIIGTGMTAFALGVWVFSMTRSATLFAMITLSATLPSILLSPVAGALVDRWDRRTVMIVSDVGAALATLVIAILVWRDSLEIWHIYVTLGFASICNAFQQPAFQVAATMLVPKKDYVRASGMMQAGMGSQFIVSPILAGLLVGIIGIRGIILIDFVTFFFALGTLLLVAIPNPKASLESLAAQGTLLREIAYAWNYLRQRPGLFYILLIMGIGNFMVGFLVVLAGPMMLAMFDSAALYGVTMSIAGSGMLVGSVILGVWGGPKQLVRGLFIAMLVGGLGILVMGLRPSVVLITAACFAFFLCMPLVQGCFETLLRVKVIADIQGRIFSFTRMLAMLATTAAYVIAGPIADYVFEPLMALNGPLAGTAGLIIGTGPGRGIGLLLVISGALIMVVTAVGYLNRRVRLVEQELPDVVADETSLKELLPLPG